MDYLILQLDPQGYLRITPEPGMNFETAYEEWGTVHHLESRMSKENYGQFWTSCAEAMRARKSLNEIVAGFENDEVQELWFSEDQKDLVNRLDRFRECYGQYEIKGVKHD